ncbi:MAG: 50S ribosomal protein L5 [Candidatus Nanoarchaeia archaeon]|jgi:large subunit ribosomal protein L5|nr:50S ribosomal protein L5 [Candidatus Nanoarchaeia archaeon]MDD3993961.1 50S ribosomal protein L5 [Candidatus Nanoarchaeia archaeon]MDD4563291.1 50S ribosomal protein L5 [Candidatus Nanoarchaeia archaeon]
MEHKKMNFKLEKVVLNIGGTGEKLDKGVILLENITNKKPIKVKATKRIPTWQVRPGLEVGTKVTLRREEAFNLLKKLLIARENTLLEKQIQKNFFSFGIPEYIEIPGMEYIREVGIMGLEVTVVFSRPGKYSGIKKIKKGKPRRLDVDKEEIIKYLEDNFQTKIIRRKKQNDNK